MGTYQISTVKNGVYRLQKFLRRTFRCMYLTVNMLNIRFILYSRALTVLLSSSHPLTLSVSRPAGWLLSGMAGLSVSSEVVTLPDSDSGQTGLRSCHRTWNVPFFFFFLLLFCFTFLMKRWKIPASSLCPSNRKHFLGNNRGWVYTRNMMWPFPNYSSSCRSWECITLCFFFDCRLLSHWNSDLFWRGSAFSL